ncbi:hypothetical protein ACFDTO_14285 [Microbacteriaceae bacterium 4G12]
MPCATAWAEPGFGAAAGAGFAGAGAGALALLTLLLAGAFAAGFAAAAFGFSTGATGAGGGGGGGGGAMTLKFSRGASATAAVAVVASSVTDWACSALSSAMLGSRVPDATALDMGSTMVTRAMEAAAARESTGTAKRAGFLGLRTGPATLDEAGIGAGSVVFSLMSSVSLSKSYRSAPFSL